MAKEELNEHGVTPGVMAIIELTAIKSARAMIKEYETSIQGMIPREKCEGCMAIIAKREVDTHSNSCPFKKIMWMCLGGSTVLSVVASIVFNAIRIKLEMKP